MKTLVVIVTYNGIDWLDKCIGTLYNKQDIELFVVDNASKDNTCEAIEQRYPKVLLEKSKENLGFGKANNIGLKYALMNNFDYVFLLNQDASISQLNLHKLIEISKSDSSLGIISPVHFKNQEDIEDLFFTYLKGTSFSEFKDDTMETEELKFVNAALWLLPIQIVKEIGGFNPLFFHYGEDVDYINRVKYLNFKVVYVNGVKGYHYRDYFKKVIRYKEKSSKKKHFGPWPVRYNVILSNINYSFLTGLGQVILLFLVSLMRHLLQGNLTSLRWDFRIFFKVMLNLPMVIKNRKLLKKSGPNFLMTF